MRKRRCVASLLLICVFRLSGRVERDHLWPRRAMGCVIGLQLKLATVATVLEVEGLRKALCSADNF